MLIKMYYFRKLLKEPYVLISTYNTTFILKILITLVVRSTALANFIIIEINYLKNNTNKNNKATKVTYSSKYTYRYSREKKPKRTGDSCSYINRY